MYQWNTIYTYDLKHLADCCKEEWILTKSTGFIKATICRILCRFAEALNKLFWSFETDVKWPENSKATVQVDLLHSLKEQSRKILLPSAGATWSRPAANTSVHDLTQCHIKTKAAHTEGPQSLNNYCTCTLSVFCLLWSATAHYGTVRSWKHSVTPARVCVCVSVSVSVCAQDRLHTCDLCLPWTHLRLCAAWRKTDGTDTAPGKTIHLWTGYFNL